MEEKNVGLIYCATNKINQKMYIGMTTKELDCRKQKHHWKSFGRTPKGYFHRAIRYYGKEAFTWRVLEDNIPIEKLPEIEMVYIDLFGTFLYNNGYNMTHGGEGTFGKYPSEETKKKMSISSMGNSPSKEVRQKISVANTGKKRSKETCQKLRDSYTEEHRRRAHERTVGKKNPMYGRKGKLAPCYGRTGAKHPMYGKTRTEAFKDSIGRPILQYQKDGTFIKEWSRIKLASERTGADSSSIIKVCQGVQKTAKGFIWKYKDVD